MDIRDEIIAQIKSEIESKAKQAEEEANENTMANFSKKAPDVVRSAMDQFYLSYDSDRYVRTHGLHGGVISSFNITTKGNFATVTISSDGVPDHAHDTGEYIYKGAFRRGIHGTRDVFVSIPPKMIIQDDLQSLMDDIQETELRKAAKKYLGR